MNVKLRAITIRKTRFWRINVWCVYRKLFVTALFWDMENSFKIALLRQYLQCNNKWNSKRLKFFFNVFWIVNYVHEYHFWVWSLVRWFHFVTLTPIFLIVNKGSLCILAINSTELKYLFSKIWTNCNEMLTFLIVFIC